MASKIFFCLLLIIFLGVQASQVSCGSIIHDSNFSMQALHQEWMTLHKKNYTHPNEHNHRFKIFEENVNYINTFNAKPNKSYKLGINKFTDLTNDEFHKIYASGYKMVDKPRGLDTLDPNDQKRFTVQDSSETNDYCDWEKEGAVTPVKDQGQCGSCWAFSVVAAVETLLWLNINHRNVSLSEQVILNCGVVPSSNGCGGNDFSVAYDVVKKLGTTSDEFFPYIAPNKGAYEMDTVAKVGYKIGDYTQLEGPDGTPPAESAVLEVVRKQPVSVSINADALQSYEGGIFDDKTCSADTNHAVAIVGFGTSEDGIKYWKVKNSWGKNWGEDGFFRIQRDQRICGIATEAYYPNGPI
ncbi:unnamed protein product [Cuscuta epithymum]|uniref:Uncharacterized protein n=1 Tax=Cuscuta epithymum TaxID=186058 RepID=A0AAV0G2Z3_9ASTE|nr:unnamed protein product [Cuscuta epithymum]CAH9141953.1 unnamed protein product [Cuscuta epithymum]